MIRFAVVKFRRGEGWDVRPEREAIDGTRVVVSSAGYMEREGSIYEGEELWLPEREGNELPYGAALIGWIAEGDLIFEA